MEIVIDFYSNKPIYEQIAEQIKSEIHLGKIGVGYPLPSIINIIFLFKML